MDSALIIDAHQHFWDYSPEAHPWIDDGMAVLRRDFLPEHLEPELAACAVRGTVAVQAPQTLEETRFLLRIAERHPFVLGVVGWVDLRAPDVAHQLRDFAAHPRFVGVRHIVQAEPDDRFVLLPDFQRGIAALSEHGLTYDILVYPHQLPAVLELVQKFPDQPFVVDHLAKPRIAAGELEPWASDIRAIARHPMVHCKVSGMVTEADPEAWQVEHLRPYLDVVFDAFGPDRLMFGSDWPVCTLVAEYRQVFDIVRDYIARLSEAERKAVLGGTACHFYGLRIS